MLLEHVITEGQTWDALLQAKRLILSLAKVVPDLYELIDVAKSEELPRMLSVLKDIMDKKDDLSQLQKFLPVIQNVANKLERFV